jgi:hypothetical protein
MSKIRDLEDIISEANRIHNNKYEYVKNSYKGIKYKMDIICPIHGKFSQIVYKHIKQGHGCPECGLIKCKNNNKNRKTKISDNHKVSFYEFIKRANEKYHEKFLYEEETFKNMNTKMNIFCKKHGWFKQTPHQHLKTKFGCKKCANEYNSKRQLYTFEKFAEMANKIHNNKYIYNKDFGYEKWSKKIPITCRKHGIFWQTPNEHLQGYGCPFCCDSKLEREVRTFLEENGINFVYEKKFEWLTFIGKMSIDFYIPDYNIAIECQGEQHFKPVRFGGCSEEIAKHNFQETIKRDIRKKELCEEHNIPLIYIKKEENIKNILKNIFTVHLTKPYIIQQ